ncbi:TetR family transcriptional regulator [Rhodococcus sp. SRB_17]|nr:TetR family transcriptional regulator [Rhodococcus sp. SRB_17]
MNHARELFVANGFKGTSVAAVGRAAGIAPAAVHWYFPTKDDLFAAALAQLFSRAREATQADPEIAGDPRGELLALLIAMRPYRNLHREAYERIESSPALADVYEEMQNWLDTHLLAIVSDHLPPEADIALIADTAHVLFEGLLISSRRLDRPTSDLIDLLTEALVAVAKTKAT